MLNYQNLDIRWDGHASLRFEDEGFTVTVDPYSRVCEEFEADIVLVTHGDSGHYDPEMLDAVCSNGSCLVVPGNLRGKELPCEDVEFLEEGDVVEVYGVEIEAVPMYNARKDHADGLGYRILMGETSIYVAGDTGVIDEASRLEGRVDIAFLPVDGDYTMGLDEAVDMAVSVKPDTVVPYHYGEPFFGEVNTRALSAELEQRSIGCDVIEP